jgi:two-component system, LytTR family, response regulator
MAPKTINPRRLVLPGVEKNIIENPSEIAYCEADDHCVYFYMRNGERNIIIITLKRVGSLLGRKGFYKIHRSFIVNLDCVKYYYKNGSSLMAELENKAKVPVARARKKDFEQRARRFPYIARV